MHTQIHTYIFWDLGIYMLRLRGRFHTSSVITHLCIYERIFQNLGEPWPPLTACGSTISCHGSVWQLEWYLGVWFTGLWFGWLDHQWLAVTGLWVLLPKGWQVVTWFTHEGNPQRQGISWHFWLAVLSS